MTPEPVVLADVEAAAHRLKGVARVTPVLTSRYLDDVSGATVYLKCENFQRIGAFKFRGAYNAIASLPPDTAERPIVTLSSGNHAQGIALAAHLLGRAAHIVMHPPINPLKRAAVLGYHGTIHEAPSRDQADSLLETLRQELRAIPIHAFNDPHVIAGQGTATLEFLDAVPDLEVILAPIGGGGLLSGTSIAGHGRRPSLLLYACEPTGALDAMHSVRENRIVPMPDPRTIAEGLRTTVGTLTLPILRQHLAGFFTVEENEIVRAMQDAFERMKLVIEPSSAVALAPLLRSEPALRGKRVGVIVTGGNADVSSYFDTLSRSIVP